MIKKIGSSDFKGFLRILSAGVLGFLLALVLVGGLFMKTHWVGFMKFVNDPYFFDQLEVSRDYQLK